MTNKDNMVQSFSHFLLLFVCVTSGAVVDCVAVVYGGDNDSVQNFVLALFSSFVTVHLLFVDTKPEVASKDQLKK